MCVKTSFLELVLLVAKVIIWKKGPVHTDYACPRILVNFLYNCPYTVPYHVVIGCSVQTNDLVNFLLCLLPNRTNLGSLGIDCNASKFKHDDITKNR